MANGRDDNLTKHPSRCTTLSLYIYKKKALRISATATRLVAIAVMHTDEVLCSYEEK